MTATRGSGPPRLLPHSPTNRSRTMMLSREINGKRYTSKAWRNRMGEDIAVPSGTIEILWPIETPSSEPFRARFIPAGELVATMAGAALMPAVAVENMEAVETHPGLLPTPGGRRISFKD